MKRGTVFEAIRQERYYQDLKWGRSNGHDVGAWLLIMEGELNEAKKAWTKTPGSDSPALAEIIQVIAVGTACLEQHAPEYQKAR